MDKTTTETYEFPATVAANIARNLERASASKAPPAMMPAVAARVAQVNGARPATPQHSKVKGPTTVVSPVVAERVVEPQPVSAPAVEPPAEADVSLVVTEPVFSVPNSDAEAISVGLPTRFAFYDFKDLYVRPLRIRQMAKINKAHEEQSMLPLVEAVSATLSSSCGRPNLGFELSVADFYFVLYWLRLNSFAKSPIQHTTYCLHPQHIKDVKDQKLADTTLEISTVVDRTQLVVNSLTELPDPKVFKLANPNWRLRPATMLDTVAYLENPNWLDPEFQYIAKLASNIDLMPGVSWKEPGRRPSLEEKIELVESWGPDEAQIISKFETLMDSIGVKELTTVTCKWCGASRESEIILDAHSFLSA